MKDEKTQTIIITRLPILSVKSRSSVLISPTIGIKKSQERQEITKKKSNNTIKYITITLIYTLI